MGHFTISKEAVHFMQNGMDESNVNDLFQFIPQEMDVYYRQDKNLIPTRASIFKNQPQEEISKTSQTRSKSSQMPHINEGDEVHFFFGSSYIICFNLNDHHYSLIVQPGDWLYIPSNVKHWIKATQDNYLIIVSYSCLSLHYYKE